MSSAVVDGPIAGAAPKTHAVAPKIMLDQWICLWSIPIFYNLFGLTFVYLARLMPPPSPNLTTAAKVELIQTHATNLQVAMVILMLSLGLASMTNGLVVVQMRRMEGVGHWLPYGYLAALATAALPAACFAGSCSRSQRFAQTATPS